MYGREYGGEVLSFEASGALMDATLVMRDRETDSWWSIMSGNAIGGELEGEALVEYPVGSKVRWAEWKQRHPDTRVLSVDGVEHEPANPYARYMGSGETFRGTQVEDDRLPGKTPVYSFRMNETAYAVPHETVVGGAAFRLGDTAVFFYRPEGAPVLASTQAYLAPAGTGGDHRFARVDGEWRDRTLGIPFVPGEGFRGGEAPERLAGFDTYWYSWSNMNEDVVILK